MANTRSQERLIPGTVGRGPVRVPLTKDDLRQIRRCRSTRTRGYTHGGRTPKVLGVKVCPHCAEELPDEATVCSNCHKDPAAAPAWAVPRRPDEPSPWRLGDVFGQNRVLPTSDRVPAPYKRLEPEGSLGVPSKVWMSLILAFLWGTPAWMIAALLPFAAGLLLRAVGYIAGLILGIWGRAEVGASDRLGKILGNIAIAFNAFNLVWTVIGAIQYGLVVRG